MPACSAIRAEATLPTFTSARIGSEICWANKATIRFAPPRLLAFGAIVQDSSHTPSDKSARTVPTGAPFSSATSNLRLVLLIGFISQFEHPPLNIIPFSQRQPF